MPQGYVKSSELPRIIPVFPLSSALLLPRGLLPLNIFEPRYLNMIDDAMSGERLIGMIQSHGGPSDRPGLARTGCVGRITSYAETTDGCYLISLTGVMRFRVIEEVSARLPYRQVKADYTAFEADLVPEPESLDLDRGRFLAALRLYLDRRSLGIDWETAQIAPAEALINSLAMALPFSPVEKQVLLEAPSALARRDALMSLMEIDTESGEGNSSAVH